MELLLSGAIVRPLSKDTQLRTQDDVDICLKHLIDLRLQMISKGLSGPAYIKNLKLNNHQ